MTSFLKDYLLYCTHTESPPKFHLWAGLSVISHLIGRRVWMDGSIFVVRPNMYIALVGDPGLKKSTAMKIAQKMLYAVEPTIFTAPDSITKEAITKIMGEKLEPCGRTFTYNGKKQDFRQLSVFADEFVNLLNAGGNAPGMIELLTGMWDTEMYRDHTKNKGSFDVPSPYIPILGCLTTETVKKLMSEKVISTGMSRRIMFIIADRNGPPQPIPFVSPEQQAAYERCTGHCISLRDVCGEYYWAEETKPLWIEWYQKNYKRMEDRTTGDSALLNFLQTKPIYVTKIAMLLALCDYHNFATRILYPEHLNLAIQLVSEEENGASILFAGAGRNELAPITIEIEKMILEAPLGVPRRELMTRFMRDCNADELGKILSYLQQKGSVEEWAATYGLKTVMTVGSASAKSAWLEREKARLLKDQPALPVGTLPG